MKKYLPILFCCLILCIGLSASGCGRQNEAAAPVSAPLNNSEQAVAAVQKLADGDIAAFYRLLDDTMRQEMSETELQSFWNQTLLQYGAFQYYQNEITITSGDGYQTASVPCVFANGVLTLQLNFNAGGAISGFYLTEGNVTAGSPRLDRDTEVSFGSEDYPLSGSLTLPEDGDGPYPAVILVQGGGPYDRNEQIGPNVPFYNLAEQLSAQGIAVLRYDKRTYLYQTELAREDFTVYDEIIDDVAAAVAFLESEDSIQSDRIFIAGHDLAGSLIPRIAAAVPQAAGYIALAASPRPQEDLLLEQTQYVLSTESELDKRTEAQILEQTERTVQAIKELTPDSTLSPEELYNFPVSYWLDLQAYRPLLEIQSVDQPLLFIQGGRDYQVPASDLDLWKDALHGKRNASFLYYDNLNHLLMSGTGKSMPAEYQQKGTVSEEVGQAIAEFVKTRKARQN